MFMIWKQFTRKKWIEKTVFYYLLEGRLYKISFGTLNIVRHTLIEQNSSLVLTKFVPELYSKSRFIASKGKSYHVKKLYRANIAKIHLGQNILWNITIKCSKECTVYCKPFPLSLGEIKRLFLITMWFCSFKLSNAKR